MAVTFKIEHRVHHMFQYPGSGHNPLLCHMANNKYHNAQTLGNLHQNIGAFPHLADTAGSRSNFLHIHGLYGINHNRIRHCPFNHLFYGPQVCFTQERKGACHRPDSVRPQLYLFQGFLSRYVKYFLVLSRQIAANLQKKRGLSDARISSNQYKGAPYDPRA